MPLIVNRTCLPAYTCNSPEAAARIVALALISNGRVQPSELAALKAHDANAQLAITDQEWHDVINDLCIDLLMLVKRGNECLIDTSVIEAMLDEVGDVALQRRVLHLCAAVIHADGRIDEGESIVLRTAVRHWELHADEQPLLEPLPYGFDFEIASRRTPAYGDRREPVVPCALWSGSARAKGREA